jgi:hypothetical protein
MMRAPSVVMRRNLTAATVGTYGEYSRNYEVE